MFSKIYNGKCPINILCPKILIKPYSTLLPNLTVISGLPTVIPDLPTVVPDLPTVILDLPTVVPYLPTLVSDLPTIISDLGLICFLSNMF